jgi:hypothetical protein
LRICAALAEPAHGGDLDLHVCGEHLGEALSDGERMQPLVVGQALEEQDAVREQAYTRTPTDLDDDVRRAP